MKTYICIHDIIVICMHNKNKYLHSVDMTIS